MISAPRLAWLELRRQKIRVAIAATGVGFAVVLMFMQLGFMDALYRSSVNLHSRLDADLVLVERGYTTIVFNSRFSRRRLAQALGFSGVASVSPVYSGFTRWRNPDTAALRDIMILGLDPARPAIAIPELDAGLVRARYPDVVLYDASSRPEFGPIAAKVDAGERVVTEASRHRVTVEGLFRLGTSFGVDGTIVTSDLNFARIMPLVPRGAITLGLVRLEPGADPVAVRDGLAATLPRDVRVLTKQELVDLEMDYWASATPIGFVFSFGVAIGVVVGVIIVYQVLFADIADHLAQYATLKAMGYSRGYLSGVVLAKATLLAIIGFVPALALAWKLYDLTRAATMLPMILSVDRAVLVLGITLPMCWLSALIAMRKLRAADPAEIF